MLDAPDEVLERRCRSFLIVVTILHFLVLGLLVSAGNGPAPDASSETRCRTFAV
ncbi:MAG TPA: hypothetical protein VLD67_21710 [Vicinamibacterales bacterium]|nr:hypothetical protein [Vicinamibacterales bacterium]